MTLDDLVIEPLSKDGHSPSQPINIILETTPSPSDTQQVLNQSQNDSLKTLPSETKIKFERVLHDINCDDVDSDDLDVDTDIYERPSIDVLHRIGQYWDPNKDSAPVNPANCNLIRYVTSDNKDIESLTCFKIKPKRNKPGSWPYLIIDLKEVSIKLTQYQLLILRKTLEYMPIKWKIKGTNDDNYRSTQNWTLIQNETRPEKKKRAQDYKLQSRTHWNSSNNDDRKTLYEIKPEDVGYFSKFKIEFMHHVITTKQKRLAIEDIKLYGDAKRVVLKRAFVKFH